MRRLSRPLQELGIIGLQSGENVQKNVHGDVERLIEWQVVDKDEKGLVSTPYSKIVVDVRLPQGRAA